MFKTLFILFLAVVGCGCGDFTCDCGDGRKFTQTYTTGGTYDYQGCTLFCSGPTPTKKAERIPSPSTPTKD